VAIGFGFFFLVVEASLLILLGVFPVSQTEMNNFRCLAGDLFQLIVP
jgi:hypothetical protein